MATRDNFTAGTHNVLFRLDAERWAEDLERSHRKTDVRGLQEAGSRRTRRAIRKHAREFGLGRFHPRGTADPILWRKDVFDRIREERGAIEVHPSAGFMRYNPRRHVVFQGLVHKATGARVLFVNIHATAGYAKDEDATPWGDRADDWKDWAARQMYLGVSSFLAEQMKREVWDAIVLVGDFNSRLNNRGEWYYPGALLEPLIVEDTDTPRSIDRIVHTRDSKVRLLKRWGIRKGWHTDHAVHFARYDIQL